MPQFPMTASRTTARIFAAHLIIALALPTLALGLRQVGLEEGKPEQKAQLVAQLTGSTPSTPVAASATADVKGLDGEAFALPLEFSGRATWETPDTDVKHWLHLDAVAGATAAHEEGLQALRNGQYADADKGFRRALAGWHGARDVLVDRRSHPDHEWVADTAWLTGRWTAATTALTLVEQARSQTFEALKFTQRQRRAVLIPAMYAERDPATYLLDLLYSPGLLSRFHVVRMNEDTPPLVAHAIRTSFRQRGVETSEQIAAMWETVAARLAGAKPGSPLRLALQAPEVRQHLEAVLTALSQPGVPDAHQQGAQRVREALHTGDLDRLRAGLEEQAARLLRSVAAEPDAARLLAVLEDEELGIWTLTSPQRVQFVQSLGWLPTAGPIRQLLLRVLRGDREAAFLKGVIFQALRDDETRDGYLVLGLLLEPLPLDSLHEILQVLDPAQNPPSTNPLLADGAQWVTIIPFLLDTVLTAFNEAAVRQFMEEAGAEGIELLDRIAEIYGIYNMPRHAESPFAWYQRLAILEAGLSGFYKGMAELRERRAQGAPELLEIPDAIRQLVEQGDNAFTVFEHDAATPIHRFWALHQRIRWERVLAMTWRAFGTDEARQQARLHEARQAARMHEQRHLVAQQRQALGLAALPAGAVVEEIATVASRGAAIVALGESVPAEIRAMGHLLRGHGVDRVVHLPMMMDEEDALVQRLQQHSETVYVYMSPHDSSADAFFYRMLTHKLDARMVAPLFGHRDLYKFFHWFLTNLGIPAGRITPEAWEEFRRASAGLEEAA